MSFTDTQLNAMALSPKAASSLSIPGSSFILYESIQDYRQGKGSSSMKRFLVGMSFVDILSSIGWFLSTWAAPVESGVPFAAGNDRTCSFQGFLLQIAICAPLYNGALVLNYLLVIKYKWTNTQLLKLEPYLHAFIWIWGLGTSIVLLAMHLFNLIYPVCWISPPAECYGDSPPSSCGSAKYFATAFFCVPLWIAILMTIYALGNIYWTVRSTTRRMSKYSMGMSSMKRSSRNVEEVASRAVLYSVAFVITWTASTIWSVAQFFDYYPFWVSYLWTLFEPLQGFWNCLIFLHNRPESLRKVKRFLTCGLWKPTAAPGGSSRWSWRRSKLMRSSRGARWNSVMATEGQRSSSSQQPQSLVDEKVEEQQAKEVEEGNEVVVQEDEQEEEAPEETLAADETDL